MWKFRFVRPLAVLSAGATLTTRKTVRAKEEEEQPQPISTDHVKEIINATNVVMEEINISFLRLCQLQAKSMENINDHVDQLSIQWALFNQIEEIEDLIQNFEVTLNASQNSAACLEDLEGVEALQDRAEQLTLIKSRLQDFYISRKETSQVANEIFLSAEEDTSSFLEVDNVVCATFYFKNKLDDQIAELKNYGGQYIERHRQANLPVATEAIRNEFQSKRDEIENKFKEDVKAMVIEVTEDFEGDLTGKLLAKLRQHIDTTKQLLEQHASDHKEEKDKQFAENIFIAEQRHLGLLTEVDTAAGVTSDDFAGNENKNTSLNAKLETFASVWTGLKENSIQVAEDIKLLLELTNIETSLLKASSESVSVPESLAHRLEEVVKINQVIKALGKNVSVYNPTASSSKEAVKQLSDFARSKALINQGNCGLWADNVSSLMSKFYLWSSPTKMEEYNAKSGLTEVDQIISGFEYAVNSEDLVSAVKIMNQSSGEVRRIFQPWLSETRRYLEFLQAISVAKSILIAKVLSA